MRATRDALGVFAARNVDVAAYPEAASILKTPVWVATIAALTVCGSPKKGRRLLRASHFDNSAEEVKRYRSAAGPRA